MSITNLPEFISNKPQGVDTLSGGSHQKIADKVSEIIIKDLLETKIIGLEGDWGSGKSNVVKIIEEKLLESNYYTFIFDAWGNQEDLTRRTFLEQIINELLNKGLITNVKKWKKLEDQLLAKFSKTFKQKFPKIKQHWFYIVFSFLLIGILSGFYEHVLLDKDIIPQIYFGILKPVISVYLIPFILFIIGCCHILKEYNNNRKINKVKPLKEQETKWDTLGKILYWFKGQEIESEEVEQIVEKEPSAQKFREYFTKIEQDIDKKGKIVIVFDNIDRLDAEKVKSLWSSIHTFFAESKNTFKSYVIIPYNKKELIRHFEEDNIGIGFIEKSIPVSFRVTPPIVANWENFLRLKLNEAFKDVLVDKEELISLFDSYTSEKVITPRRIINYVNNIVSLYLQWESEIKKGEIKIKYLALFCLTKDKILSKPYDSIPSRDYLRTSESTFQDLEELDETIAALTFGVGRKNANEVLLLRQFQNNLKDGEAKKLVELSKHSAFKTYFKRAYDTTDIGLKINGLTHVLSSLKDTCPESYLKPFWNDFAKKIISRDDKFERFNEDHKEILLNANKDLSRKVIQKLIDYLKTELSRDEPKNETKYFENVKAIEAFVKKENINIDIKRILTPVQFSAKPYLDFVKKHPETFDNYKIDCQEKILERYVVEEDFNEFAFDNLKSSLNEFATVKRKKNFKFEKIENEIKKYFIGLRHNKPDTLEEAIKVVKSLYEKPISLSLSSSFYSSLTINKLNSNDIYYDAFCIAISNFKEANQQVGFQRTLNTLTKESVRKIYERIEWYMNYGKLINLVINGSARRYTKLKDILFGLTQNEQGASIFSLKGVMQSYDNIVELAFDSDESKENVFIERLSSESSSFDSEIKSIATGVFKHFKNKENKLIKKIIVKSQSYMNSLSYEDFSTAFSEKNKNFIVLSSLVNNNLIDKFNSQFYSAFDDYFKSLIKQGKVDDDFNFWDSLIDKMDARKLKSTFTSLRDIMLERGEISDDEILFLEKGLIAHGNLSKRPNGSTLKFIIPMIKYDNTFPHFLEKEESLMKIIEASTEYREAAINELETRFRSNKFNDKKPMLEIAKKFEWSLPNDEKED